MKSKSWNPETDAFLKTETRGPNQGMEKVPSDIAEYVYDVAFQKYVVEKSLREEGFRGEVRAYLMMADKSVASDVDGINQLFKIRHADGRIKVEPGKLDGYDECWIHSGELTENDLKNEHLLEELWNNKNTPFANGVRLLKNVSRTNLRINREKAPQHKNPGLNQEDRRIVQVALTTNQPEMLEDDLLRNVHEVHTL